MAPGRSWAAGSSSSSTIRSTPAGRGEQARHQVGELADRAVALHEQGEEGQQAAEGEPVGGQRPDAEADDEEHADQLGEVDERQEERPHPAAGELGAGDGAVLPVVVRDRLRPRGRRPARARRWTRLSSVRLPSDPPRRRRSRETSRVKSAKRLETHQKSGHDDHRGQRQLPLQPEQRADEEDQLEDRADAAGELADHEGLDRGDVGGQPGQHVAEPAPVVGDGGQGEHVREGVAPQADQELLRDPGREVVVGARHDAAEQVETDVREGEPQQRPDVGGDEHVVHQPLEEQHLDDRDRRRGGQQEHPEQQPAPQRTQPRPEAAYDVAHGQRAGGGHDRRLVDGRTQRCDQALPGATHGRLLPRARARTGGWLLR